jgi:D-alanine-D-alanine ligase
LPALQFVVPSVAYAPEVIVEPRPRLRRLPRRLTDLSAVEVVVLYSVALSLERGLPEDFLAEEETADVAHHVAEALEGEVGAVHEVPVWDDVVSSMRPFDPHRHVVFNLVESLEGRAFTEPEVPRTLRSLGFIHTGGSYRALRRGNNKLSTKRMAAEAGLHTPRFQVFHRLNGCKVEVPLPAIVKPIAEGGSLGVTQASLVRTPEELLARVDHCLQTYHQPALAEEYIAGREINVALWGNGLPEVLPLSEITFVWTKDPYQQFVTFDAKWVKTSVEYKRTPAICPARLSAQEQADIEAAACKAYQLVGVKGFARVDIRLRDGIPYILEVNVNPDLSPDAGFFRSASAAGHSYRSMVLHIVKMALDAAP